MALSEVYGWEWAYYFICIATIPVVLVLAFVQDNTNGGILTGEGGSAAGDARPGSGRGGRPAGRVPGRADAPTPRPPRSPGARRPCV